MFQRTTMNTISVVTSCMIGVALVALGSAPLAASSPGSHVNRSDVAALQVLDERIGAYAALRHRLEKPLPPLEPTTDMEALYARQALLAAAIKAARPEARQGDIFTPAVGERLREVVLEALEGVDVADLLLDLYAEDDVPCQFRARVHDEYPDWASHAMPAILLVQLPPLPDAIEYRLIGRDLILLDLRAGLIIDVLPRAIPSTTADLCRSVATTLVVRRGHSAIDIW
jgi:hypothetical protein